MNDFRKEYTLADLASQFELPLQGDGSVPLRRVGTLAEAGCDALSFLSNQAYRSQLKFTRAGAVILKPDDAEHCPVPCLLAADPYLTYAQIAKLFDHRPVSSPGIDPQACVHESATLGQNVAVCAGAVISQDARIGSGSIIGPGCVVGPGADLGEGCRLVANVTIADGVQLGQRVLVHPGAVIGADGFGIARGPDRWEKVPQLGGVVVGDDCEIGANTCIDRGAIGDTVLEADVRLDNHVQIGHNCHIGAHTAMAAFAGISGSTVVGKNCLFAGRASAYGHITIADGVTISAQSVATKDIRESGTVWSGFIPASPIREWQKTMAQLRRLRKTLNRLKKESKQDKAP